MSYKTEQEEFWAGKFGTDYINRNNSEYLLNSKISIWSRMLRSTNNIKYIREFGCNIGLNLIALKKLNPKFQLSGYEINEEAIKQANKYNIGKIKQCSILEKIDDEPADLVFTVGVLIHINPDYLKNVYDNFITCSKRYILIAEYYSPQPSKIVYRGNKNKLFKRDFAGELIDEYKLNLVDYGFFYNRDNLTPQDDINWFLLEK